MPDKSTLASSLASSRRRIAWYLSLGDLSNFSERSVAPASSVRRLAATWPNFLDFWSTGTGPRSEGEAADQRPQPATPTEILASPGPPASKLSLNHFARRSMSPDTLTRSKIPGSGLLAPHLNVSQMRDKLVPGSVLGPRPITSLASDKEPFQPAKALDSAVRSYVIRTALFQAPTAPPPFGSQTVRAGISVAPQGQSHLETKDESERRTGEVVMDQAAQTNPMASDCVLSSAEDAQTYSGGQAVGQSSSAMLHLDGAVLGHWTIQHLERALSKPSSGMTGVDPRATTPRGHVSPF